MNPKVVTREQWLQARRDLLVKEKELTLGRDRVARLRRDLPWVKIDKQYAFEGSKGKLFLPDLFGAQNQLVVYHFMFAPEWEVGCKSCSFWADTFNGVVPHLKARDTAFAVVSLAPYAKLGAYRKRMGWRFKWVSSFGSDFNFDFNVSFTPEQLKGEVFYNFQHLRPWGSETPGISVFFKDRLNQVFHTYSCYSRGLDAMNAAYQYLDLTPKGRDESGQGPNPQAWVKRHDEYPA